MKFCANSSSQFVPLANRQIKVGPCHFEVLHAAFLYARMMPKDRYAMLDNDKLQQCQQQSIVLDLLQFFCETTFDAMSQFKACQKKCHFSSFLAYFCATKCFTSKLRMEIQNLFFFYKNCKYRNAFQFSLIFQGSIFKKQPSIHFTKFCHR